ncbi:MAG TPA: bacillithiol biosynthesis BshC [Methylomirabilota bacterium]|nr:bacillithiol biosynthesis BshC [Methylomirabilota bacterium]
MPIGPPAGRATGADRGPLADPLTLDLLANGPIARERVAASWRDTDALKALAGAKRAPLPSALAEALAEMHRRLGASPASLANLERLARGESVAAVAGQQPAPLGGPLYSLHKTAAAVGLAREVTRRTGAACVPLFWTHSEDSDFAEIRGASVCDAELQLIDLQLPDAAHADGGLVGAIAVEPLRELGEQALAAWSGLPGLAEAAETWRRSLERARDLGEAMSALWLALFSDAGLVVVEPRLPAFRAAARPIVDRYLAHADALHAAARNAGARIESLAGRRALADAALDSFVFEVSDGGRRKIAAADARARGAAVTLSPSVALRAAVQDGVFPTVAMACGPGELAYLMQLREVFDAVGVRAAAPAVRFGATWLPPAAVALAEAAGGDAWEVVAHTDAVLARVAETRVPGELQRALATARAAADQSMARLAEVARGFDASLPQMVESARGKIDFQVSRLAEGVLGKARGRLDREQPLWRRLRYVLQPGDRLQERRLASLEVVARRGRDVVRGLCDLATEHAHATADGVHEHYLLEA